MVSVTENMGIEDICKKIEDRIKDYINSCYIISSCKTDLEFVELCEEYRGAVESKKDYKGLIDIYNRLNNIYLQRLFE
ncbi:MAG: hypothetical protein B6U88_02040 [Candidatus Aenigmarchaeota archaeon ex4484_56]|nr:MAG: hypothetical protein B6U88_02040 [Candidatus Aenigmarchaeota archaeon ex4484_56]